MQQEGLALQFAAPALKADRALVEEAAAQNGLALQVNILQYITVIIFYFSLSSLTHTNFSLSFLASIKLLIK